MTALPRFDDRLSTILANPADDDRGRAVLWTQIADILAQDRGTMAPERRAEAYAKLAQWRDLVPALRRQSVAAAIASPRLSPDFVKCFALDTPAVAAPVLLRAKLSDSEWATIVPDFPRSSRALLRERRDLPAETMRNIESFGPADLALPPQGGDDSVAELRLTVAPPAPQPNQIRNLVDRIEAFRRDRAEQPVHSAPLPARFRFESNADGVIEWVDGISRAAIIGVTLAEMAEPGGYGVDGTVAGAFRQRTVIDRARLLIGGNSDVAGVWLITAKPCFDGASGRFVGYRGSASRSTALAPFSLDDTTATSTASSDAMRQLVHELRTPLNAIRGFAEMIDGQLLGPVSRSYRDRAASIVKDAAMLMTIFDDLDTSARLARGDMSAPSDAFGNIAKSLALVARALEPLSDERGVHVKVAITDRLPPVAIDSATLDRLIEKLIGTVIGVSLPQETIRIDLESGVSHVVLTIDRPSELMAVADHRLLEAAYDDDQNHAFNGAPPLGLGFTFRLVDNLARSVGGAFDIGRSKFALRLPAIRDSARQTEESI